MTQENLKVDALVVGGGISGMQSALDLADQGYQVALVERQPSIGGKMIALSKVFPTLDCCSCITTPKMSAVAHHENISLLTYCEVEAIQPSGDGYNVDVLQKPRYVDVNKCTGCRQCEYVCPIDLPSSYDSNLGAIRTVRVPFSTAVPQKAVIDLDYCILCGKCEQACAVDAIDFSQQPEHFQVEAQSIVLATGFEITPRDAKREYGAGALQNVIDGLTMERLLAPTGPYGHVIRPSDGKEPDSIAYVQCAGSRDETLGVPYCSRVCCMYAIKQAMLLSGALPLPPALLRSLARYGGCNVWCEQDVVLSASNDMVSIHGVDPGPYTVHLPRTVAKVTDAVTGEVVGEDVDQIEVTLDPPETKVFFLD